MTAADRRRRWRLILGEPAGDACGKLSPDDGNLDRCLAALYDAGGGGGRPDGSSRGKAGLGGSNPNVARWLGDVRGYFPKSVVQVMQRDALDRLNLTRMLTEPELLETVEADVHLVGTLLSLGRALPAETRETARSVVRKVCDELQAKLAEPMRRVVSGALNKAVRNSRPRAAEIDWDRTIRKNLHNYLPDRGTVVAERLVGHGRKRSALRDVVLCVDQSGSMATSVVYSGIFGAVLASLRAVRTSIVVFDTAVVDLTDLAADPVDLLFGTQLGGGTDINRALAYCQGLIDRPERTVFVLVTDLYEGGDNAAMLRRAGEIVASGARAVCLLALSDEGAAMSDAKNAAAFAELGIPAFACTPDRFPDLMAAALKGDDLAAWAGTRDIKLAGV